MFTDTLLPKTAQVLLKLKQLDALQSFYLSDGTVLALQIGHRESEDLDFFSQTFFDPFRLQGNLQSLGVFENTELSEGTLNTYVNGVRLQFLMYPYLLLEQCISWEGISLSSLIDIACTKLITISMRGSKKDFIDLYFLLQTFTLPELLQKIEQKYQNIHYSDAHILKSLVYFEDADVQPMPRMHENIIWENVKKYFTQMVKPLI